MIRETETGYECDDPRVRLVDILERKNVSPPIFTLVVFLHDGARKTFGGKPFSFTDKLIAEAEEWLKSLPA